MNLLIKSQSVTPENTEENTQSSNRAAQGAAVEHENAVIDPDLLVIIERWPDLPDALKAGIVAMIQTAKSK